MLFLIVHRLVGGSYSSCDLAGPVLGVFAKLRKATINFVMSVCPSVIMEHLGYHVKEFHEIVYLIIFRKSVEKIQFSLKSDKNKGYAV